MADENLKSLTIKELLERTRKVVSEERRINSEVLRLLQELDRRRVYATLGFKSLFDFCVQGLKYSESSAWRRISAMRLMRDIPEVEEKIATGVLSLSSATTLQRFLYGESKSAKINIDHEMKRKLVESIENKSARETERILTELSPNHLPSERTRTLTPEHSEIKFVADQQLYQKLERLKDLNCHRDPSRSYRPLFDWMSDLALKQTDPLYVKPHSVTNRAQTTATSRDSATKLAASHSGRTLPAALRRAVWQRDGGQCTYIHAQTQRRCGSTRFLEIDHIKPFALGGENALDNLRLYCRMHNQYAAIRTYGELKIRG